MPGAVTNPLAAVPLALIRDGATMIRGAADLLEDLGLAAGTSPEGPAGPGDGAGLGGATAGRALGPLEERVLGHVADATLPEAVAAAAGLPVAEVLAALTRLEILGLVRRVGGRVERRLSP